MSSFLNGTWRHAKDRRVIPVTSLRLLVCAVVALASFTVGLPTHLDTVSIVFFFPLVFGVAGAISLSESVLWLRPRNPWLKLSRGLITMTADVVCVSVLFVSLGGVPEREGAFSGALLAAALGMATALFAQEYAWLAAGFVGFVCLLSFERALVLDLPLAVSLPAYLSLLVIHSWRGPRSVSAA